MTRARLIGLAFFVLMAACGTTDVDGVDDAAETTASTESAPAAGEGEPSTSTTMADDPVPTSSEQAPDVLDPNPQIAIAQADLSERLGVEIEAISVILTEAVTWRDGSLGCPQPGATYTQALVSGRRIVLEVDGVKYHYHSGPSRDAFFCADPASPVAGDPGDA